MWVVKVGGSLARSAHLPRWRALLAEHGGGRVVVVPGGGPYADLVRAEQARDGFDDRTAHWMAILAMEQFGFQIAAADDRFRCAATRAEIAAILAAGQVPVWLAYPMLVSDETLPRDWSVSADSAALWLTRELGAAALLLLKSAPAPVPGADFEALAQSGLVDAHFPVLARTCAAPIRLLGPDDTGLLEQALASGRVPAPPLLAGG